MADTYPTIEVLGAIAAASAYLSDRKEEINRLNVFPVPDGDTGTNMSLTLESVVQSISALPPEPKIPAITRAITNGALMGARGNSGVITSQIFRGFCEGHGDRAEFSIATLDDSFQKAVEVAFAAVRKPVEGTILTVLRDTADAVHAHAATCTNLDELLEVAVAAAYESVERTPELLPVLKENHVVDAGGYGLAVLFDGFVSSLLGKEGALHVAFSVAGDSAPKVEIEQINDWEGSRFRYCNEFLVESDTLDKEEALEFLATMGDCELCVGENPRFKVHVHSNTPNLVLAYFLERGQIFEVFIHNMQLQSAERTEKLQAEQESEDADGAADARPRKPLGFVAVAAGDGNAAILQSLGVDVVVSGGQTMNPSTKDLLDAAQRVNSDAVIILPNNSNIIMAAQSAAELCDKPCAVVPTKSVPAAFSALFGVRPNEGLEENVASMCEAFADTHTGEITTAVKRSQDAYGNPIQEGDVIGIADGSIESVGASVEEVVQSLLKAMEAQDRDSLTLLCGSDLDDDRFQRIVESIEDEYEDLEIDAHRGEQPLYPIILSLE